MGRKWKRVFFVSVSSGALGWLVPHFGFQLLGEAGLASDFLGLLHRPATSAIGDLLSPLFVVCGLFIIGPSAVLLGYGWSAVYAVISPSGLILIGIGVLTTPLGASASAGYFIMPVLHWAATVGVDLIVASLTARVPQK